MDPPEQDLSEFDHAVQTFHPPPLGRYRQPVSCLDHGGDGVGVPDRRHSPLVSSKSVPTNNDASAVSTELSAAAELAGVAVVAHLEIRPRT